MNLTRATMNRRPIKGCASDIIPLTKGSEMMQQYELVDRLTEAISGGEVEVWMQPLVDFVRGEIVSSEALVRWNYPGHGLLAPYSFIPLLEEAGRISELDRFVWRKACQLAGERQRETGRPPLPFSVNVSRAEILQPDLADYLLGLLNEHGLQQGTLRLEITETAYVTDPDELMRAVADLRDRGFIVEMDDFGSGYSSLNMLRNLPVDVLKLDMGFLHRSDSNANDAVILNSVIRMAHGLNIPVIAEGVETVEQAEMLKTMGCRLMQGYFFAKPMPMRDFYKLLDETRASRHTYRAPSDNGRVGRLLDQRGDTAFFFNHCAGPAFVYSVNAGVYEIMLANDDLYDELGVNPNEVNLFQTNPLSLMDGDGRDAFRRATQRALVSKVRRCTVRLAKMSRWLECTLRVIESDETGGVLVCYVFDATEDAELALAGSGAGTATNRGANAPVSAQGPEAGEALRDEFTGLLTYHALETLVMAKAGDEGGTLLLVDVDEYETLIAGLAQRGSDEENAIVDHLAVQLGAVLPKKALLARCGECLFAAFVPGMSDQIQVRTWACSLIDALRSSTLKTGERITCSLGLAAATKGTAHGLAIMYRRALRALTIVKLNGGDGFLLYETARNQVNDSIEVFGVPLRHAADGELLPEKALEGKGLFDIISRDFEANHTWNMPSNRKQSVRDAVFGALRYRSMAEVPGILSFDYDVAADTMFFESVGDDGQMDQRIVRGFHRELFTMSEKLAEESMARLSALLCDLTYLPVSGSLDLKCRLSADRPFSWYRFSFTCLRDEESFVIRGLGYGEDIDLSRESGAWWKDRAMHDGLTGLLNREGLEDAVEAKLSKIPGGIMFVVNVDDFKKVNDALGHLAGDSVLCELADTLLVMFRESDVVGRFGADQMIAFISGVTNKGLAESRAADLVRVASDIEIGSYGHITASVGAAVIDRVATFYDFLELGDHAMHEAKNAGKNCYRLTTPEDHPNWIHDMRISPESHHTPQVQNDLEEWADGTVAP